MDNKVLAAKIDELSAKLDLINRPRSEYSDATPYDPYGEYRNRFVTLAQTPVKWK